MYVYMMCAEVLKAVEAPPSTNMLDEKEGR
jgi:hypothetical protein